MKRNIKSSFLKARYLNEKYKETKELFEKHYMEFFKAFELFAKENNIEGLSVLPPNVSEETAVIKASDNKDIDSELGFGTKNADEDFKNIASEELKKLYRKIVTIVHPDKHPEHISEDKKKEMIEIYNKSTMAMRNGDVFSVLDAASELYIDLPKLSDEEIKIIKEKCLFFEDNIKLMKNTYAFVWGEESDLDKKESVMKLFVDSKKEGAAL